MAPAPRTSERLATAEEAVSWLKRAFWTSVTTGIGFIGSLFIVGHALYVQIGDVKTEIAVAKNNISNVGERLNRIEQSLAALPRIEALLRNAPAPAPPPGSPPPVQVFSSLGLTDNEVHLIQGVLKPTATGKPLKFKIGDQISDVIVPRLPDAIVEKVPKLRGFRYTIDQSGAVLIVEDARNTVVSIIPPA